MSDDFMTNYRASIERCRATIVLNKNVVFGALAKAGIAKLVVSFDGSGDQGQIEKIEVMPDIAFPTEEVALLMVEYGKLEAISKPMSLELAIEQIVYDCLEIEHDGWENNEGAYGDIVFDVPGSTIRLFFNERVQEINEFMHNF